MIDTGFLNMFYFYPSSIKSPVHLERFYLDGTVDADILNEAVKKAVKCHYFFGLKPVLDDKGIVWFEENNAEPPVFYDDGAPRYLGSDETNGYLFRVLYKDNCISVSDMHALSDGRGLYAFLGTLLYEYYTLKGQKIDPEGCVLTEEGANDKGVKAQLLDEIPRGLKPDGMYIPEDVFIIPEERTLIETVDTKVFSVEFDAKDLLSFAGENGGTPATVIMTLMSDLLYEIYDVGNKEISASLPVDMRRLFSEKALSNYCSAATVPFRKELKDKTFKEKVLSVREELKIQTKKENLIVSLYPSLEMKDMVRAQSLAEPEVFTHQIQKRAQKEKTTAPYTYILTNVGRFPFPRGVLERITCISMYAPNTGGSPLLGLFTLGERMHLYFYQNFETNALSEGMVRKFKERGIDAKITSSGMYRPDPVKPELFFRI
ncbi:MAG: hypothetical protein K6A38_08445 [Lachnospiraceae bacterium]|nr:hypothetical protein [Lachnospiraceae bacterium]